MLSLPGFTRLSLINSGVGPKKAVMHKQFVHFLPFSPHLLNFLIQFYLL
uniref:Uncharacterized protein n=1 Tax=Anguilla anguilla TaxID=7936 RepID=A0A0E9TUY8_ANGAN